MNAEQIEQIEREMAEAKTRMPDWSDPFWKTQLVPYLVRKEIVLWEALTNAKPEDVPLLQGKLQAIRGLINEPAEIAKYEKMVADELAKWKKGSAVDGNRGGESPAPSAGTGNAWLAGAGRRFAGKR